jgi:hypothetical protein
MFLATSCGISEDCFKGNGNQVTQIFPLENFTKIKVYDGVGLVIKEGTNYEVKVITSDNILDNLEVKLEGSMLVIKDNSTCNLARDYGQTKVYVTVPDGTLLPIIPELELHCKTEQKIESQGVLRSPIIRLFSIDVSDGAGTGDFHLNISSQQLYVESNNVSNFYLLGQTDNLHVFFSWGNGVFYGNDLFVNNELTFIHRGSNEMKLFPLQIISGHIYSTGNVILKNNPIQQPNVIRHYLGRLIYDF